MSEEQANYETGKQVVRVEHASIAAMVEALDFDYYVVPGTTTTLCTAIGPNGFVLAVGKSACISPANFNAETGKKYAREDAIQIATNELWKLEGYRLKHG